MANRTLRESQLTNEFMVFCQKLLKKRTFFSKNRKMKIEMRLFFRVHISLPCKCIFWMESLSRIKKRLFDWYIYKDSLILSPCILLQFIQQRYKGLMRVAMETRFSFVCFIEVYSNTWIDRTKNLVRSFEIPLAIFLNF
jgi:hypothetical protein